MSWLSGSNLALGIPVGALDKVTGGCGECVCVLRGLARARATLVLWLSDGQAKSDCVLRSLHRFVTLSNER